MRPRGDDHDHDFFARPRAYGDYGDDYEDGELESELARRLRNLSWPAPPPGLKERCLREILARMAEEQEKKNEPFESTRYESPGGSGDRYAVTRRVADVPRAPIPMSPRPLRLAAVL